MFDKDNNQFTTGGSFIEKEPPKWKKFIPFIIGLVVFLFLITILVLVLSGDKKENGLEEDDDKNDDIVFWGLPSHGGLQDPPDDDDVKVDPVSDEAVEYLTFIDFYQKPQIVNSLDYLDYELPLDIKSQVVNYYDLNRRINLDPYIDDLSKKGFTKISNPWPDEIDDFYRAYDILAENQIPLFISTDFIFYHYNLILNKVWQEIENSFFYDSLWEINKRLYEKSRINYENYLDKVGQINDPILEAKRLKLAYFAVALELLKPDSDQVREGGADDGKFSISESRYLDFDLPDYLKKDVIPEIELIKEARQETRSPVFLYERNYMDFSVPREYRQSARKNNFYLASKWLSSLFPLNPRSEDCPDCLLDQNDWRINFTAASMISEKIASSQFLKAEWARIYKIMSYFSGLEDTLTYLYFQEDFQELFGDKTVTEVFSLENENSNENIEKFRNQLLSHDFKEIQGGADFSLPENKAIHGFRLLAKSHWPIDYLRNKLTHPNVTTYNQSETARNNVTSCRYRWRDVRCFSFFADNLNLLGLEISNDYIKENTNYENYDSVLEEISLLASNSIKYRINNYWSKLATINLHLNTDDSALPIFAQNYAWRERLFYSAGAAILDWQMPSDIFRRVEIDYNQNSLLGFVEEEKNYPNIYIEPFNNLINDLLANTQMISKMLSALGADTKSGLAMLNLDALYSDLDKLSQLTKDNVEKQDLSKEDQELLLAWLRSYEIVEKADKRIRFSSDLGAGSLTQNLNELEFLIIVFPTENGPTMALSPIYKLREH